MTNNPDLVEDVKEAFKKSSKEQWLLDVRDASLSQRVKAEFKLTSSNVTPWEELRKRGIVVTSMTVTTKDTVNAFFGRVDELDDRKTTTQSKETCECCGQETTEEETRTFKGIKTKAGGRY